MGICSMIQGLKPGLCNNPVGWDGEGGGKDVQERGDIGISIADSCWCLAETNTQQNK